jgi:hypothetical protein
MCSLFTVRIALHCEMSVWYVDDRRIGTAEFHAQITCYKCDGRLLFMSWVHNEVWKSIWNTNKQLSSSNQNWLDLHAVNGLLCNEETQVSDLEFGTVAIEAEVSVTLTRLCMRCLGFSNYKAANILLKEGSPRVVQCICRAYTASHNRNPVLLMVAAFCL